MPPLFRQMQINHQLRHTGTPDTIFEHPKWALSADPINLYQGRIAPL